MNRAWYDLPTPHLLVHSQQWKHKNNVWRQWSHSGVFIINFEQTSHTVLVIALLTLNKLMTAGFSTNKVNSPIIQQPAHGFAL